jgi:hypothetical protein
MLRKSDQRLAGQGARKHRARGKAGFACLQHLDD